jgi:hypothetical protein
MTETKLPLDIITCVIFESQASENSLLFHPEQNLVVLVMYGIVSATLSRSNEVSWTQPPQNLFLEFGAFVIVEGWLSLATATSRVAATWME